MRHDRFHLFNFFKIMNKNHKNVCNYSQSFELQLKVFKGNTSSSSAHLQAKTVSSLLSQIGRTQRSILKSHKRLLIKIRAGL